MGKKLGPDLRVRLIQLVLVAVLPALALILYSAGEQRVKDSEVAQREALRLVRLVASSQQRLLDSTRHLLVALSSLPEVRTEDTQACSTLFANLLDEYPLYVNLGAANLEGEVFCSAIPLPGKISIAERSYFQVAVQRKSLAIGDYRVGRVTGKARLTLGYPIIDKKGGIPGIVFAALDLTPLKQVAGMVNLPGYASLAIYDRDGTVLARYPDAGPIDKTAPEAEVVKMALTQGEGVTQAIGSDGERWLYGFTAIADTDAKGKIFLHVGIPTAIALTDANWLLKRNLAALVLVTGLALLAAWYGGDVFVLRQLRALVSTTERLGSGDLAARTGLAHDHGEIGRVAASFDAMAAALETQQNKATAAGERLGRNLARLKALHDIDMAITSDLDLHSTLHVLLEKVDLILPGAVTTIRLINKETGTLEPAACRNIAESEWRAGNPRPMNGFAKIVIESKTHLVIANVQGDPRNDGHRFAMRFGLVSYLGIPLIAKGRLLGLIAFYTKEEHAFSDEEIDFLKTLAGQSAIAIYNATLYEETRRSADEIAALHSLAIAATQSLNLQETLRSAIQKITDIFNCDAVRIFLFDDDMSNLCIAAVLEAEPGMWTNLSSFRRGQGIVGKVADSGESFICEDVHSDSRYSEFSYSKVLKDTQIKFFAALPIATKLKTWGVVVLVGKQSRRLQPHEERLLTAMTNQVGIAVENATLYSQTAAKAKELSALYSVAGIASESLNINIVLRRTMQKVLEIFDFDAARIYLRNEDDGDLHLAAQQGIPEDIRVASRYKAGEGQLGRAIETGEAIFVEDMATDLTFNKLAHNKHLLKAGYHSSFLIPLKVRGEALGVMHFVGKKPYQFPVTDVQLINAIAYHLGLAVGNARLFSQLKKKTAELERASHGKDEFLGVISHELRTPLNVIKGYTEILMNGILGEIGQEQRRALETISNQSMELFGMINGVLQVTKIEAGAIQAAAWEVDLLDLLNELRRNYDIPFGKDLAVSWDYPNDLPRIMTDDEKLKAVLQNLVNNAIKFTERGVVSVSVRHVVAKSEIEFKVTDTGIGIPREKIRTIFDMFQQVDSSATRKFGGVGLGLYIVRKYTELLGGRISVESEFEQGSTFIMSIPVSGVGSVTAPPPSKGLPYAVPSNLPASNVGGV